MKHSTCSSYSLRVAKSPAYNNCMCDGLEGLLKGPKIVTGQVRPHIRPTPLSLSARKSNISGDSLFCDVAVGTHQDTCSRQMHPE